MSFELSTRFDSAACSLVIDRLAEDLVLVRISGHDVGEFGELPMRCIDALLPDAQPAMLFVDARASRGVAIAVSGAWAQWLGRRRERLAAVHMLTASRFVAVSADFVRRFSDLEQLMQLHTDSQAFDRALLQATARG